MQTERLKIVQSNLEQVQLRIRKASERSGRDPSEVTLVAVTKSVDPEVAGLLIDAGATNIGENRIAEAERKQAVLKSKGTWHMIGHLQRNKVKKALSLFSMIHSVDSIRLMDEISSRAIAARITMEILFEVNVSGEASKYGFTPDEILAAVRKAQRLPGVSPRGLMTMAPLNEDPDASRPHFREMKNLLKMIQDADLNVPDCNLLSMGMTQDFEPAVEEGATHVRIGTALFQGL